MIRLSDACRWFETDGGKVHALQGLTLAIEPGERVAIQGRSGSGKTTALHLLAGLDRPSSGDVEVAGQSLSRLSAAAMARYRRATLGIVFQAFHLLPVLTARENVALPLMLAGVGRTERLQRADNVLEQVGLGARRTHRPAQLSGGEQQRVAIARAVVTRPQVLLADEPTGNLDSATALDVVRVLTDVADQQQLTLIVVTHDESLARRIATRVVRLRDGRLEEG
jgi:putative ABC transport system ATP-binding protein